MKFCSNCGAAVSQKIPPGDTLPRHVCDACSTIHYQNPKIIVGCIPEWEERILLCRRAIERVFDRQRTGLRRDHEGRQPQGSVQGSGANRHSCT
mgnify:CR=1 FL=1